MPQSCLPQNIYGPIPQVLFLGLTVKGFTASAGWNEQGSTLTVTLVYDPCLGSRKYCTPALTYVEDIFQGDPGWNGAPVGSPVFFKVEDFEFSGIIQSYNTTRDSNGYPIYVVTISSPNIVLENTQVVINDFQDSVYNLPNIFNAYAFLESLEEDCPIFVSSSGASFGSPSGGFGYARRTDRGVPWYLIKRAIGVLTGGFYSGSYSPNGSVVYISGVGTYGSISSNRYIVDITDLPEPEAASIYDYKLEAPNMSILEIASQVCQDAGYDFFVDMMPVRGGLDSITNIIKFRTVIRTNQPALTSISTFINNTPNVISSSIGQELRPEPNSAFLVGAKKRQYFEQNQRDDQGLMIAPFWGLNLDGNPNTAVYKRAQWFPLLDIRGLQSQLTNKIQEQFTYDLSTDPPYLGIAETAYFTETQMRAALDGIDSFIPTVCIKDPQTPDPENNSIVDYVTGVLGIRDRIIKYNQLRLKNSAGGVKIGYDASPEDLLASPKGRDFERLYNWVRDFAEENYGKKFAIAMPFICYDTNLDLLPTGYSGSVPPKQAVIFSDVPSVEGGWVTGNTLLDKPVSATNFDLMKNDNGTVNPILYFQGPTGTRFNLSGLDPNDYFLTGIPTGYFVTPNNTGMYLRSTIEERWVTGIDYQMIGFTPGFDSGVTFSGFASGFNSAAAIVSIPNRVSVISDDPAIGLLYTGLEVSTIPGSVKENEALDPDFPKKLKISVTGVVPDKAGIPVLSNTQRYGPWYKASAVNGPVYYEQDDSLAPWEFNGFNNLDAAAFSKVIQSTTEQQVSENGAVSIAGYPTVTLGTAIDGVPSLIGNRSLSVGTIGNFSYYYINVGGPVAASAQITSINVNVGDGSITTDYQISTFTPVFGRFSKNNADKLRSNAANARKERRNALAINRVNNRVRSKPV